MFLSSSYFLSYLSFSRFFSLALPIFYLYLAAVFLFVFLFSRSHSPILIFSEYVLTPIYFHRTPPISTALIGHLIPIRGSVRFSQTLLVNCFKVNKPTYITPVFNSLPNYLSLFFLLCLAALRYDLFVSFFSLFLILSISLLDLCSQVPALSSQHFTSSPSTWQHSTYPEWKIVPNTLFPLLQTKLIDWGNKEE